jgi:mannose-6-phosphate isomerase-like protein (cupin superfamily)
MKFEPVNFREKLGLFDEHWAPKIIAQMNDYHFKLVKIQGEFVWHRHAETDEVFIVLEGEMAIEFRNGHYFDCAQYKFDDGRSVRSQCRRILLHPGELFVVPKGVEHKPVAANECHVLLVEPAGLVNTGGAESELTAPNDVWI